MGNTEPWYGVRLIYRLVGTSKSAYEEQIVITCADTDTSAIEQAEHIAKDYESDTCKYTGYAMAFHIFDQAGPCLGSGSEVFSLIRESDLLPSEYLDRFHDTGTERCRE